MDATIEDLYAMGCTDAEVAAALQYTISELADEVARQHKATLREYRETIAASGRAQLRKMQWDQAMRGNTGMLVWLGKQLLGQRDHKNIEANAEHQRDTDAARKYFATIADELDARAFSTQRSGTVDCESQVRTA